MFEQHSQPNKHHLSLYNIIQYRMGASSSKESPTSNVFAKELRGINDIVNKIINADNTFINKEYNFLSQDVCDKYQVVLQSELSKHLKIHLADFGSEIYVLPKDDNGAATQKNISKSQICEKISNHYVSILYILSLIKYVYNLENNGDRSFGGIIFRNVKVVNNMIEIMYCDTDQKNFAGDKPSTRIDFAELDGFNFFTKYVLSKEESKDFMKLMRAILGRKNKTSIKFAICEALKNKTLSKEEGSLLAALYRRNYGEEIFCIKSRPASQIETHDDEKKAGSKRDIDTSIHVPKGNPVFLKSYCNLIENRVVDLSTKEGKIVKGIYDNMISNYRRNIDEIQGILTKLVVKHPKNQYTLSDIDGEALNNIVMLTKKTVRRFFIQSILDYQHLLDTIKNTPNVKLSIKTNGFI